MGRVIDDTFAALYVVSYLSLRDPEDSHGVLPNSFLFPEPVIPGGTPLHELLGCALVNVNFVARTKFVADLRGVDGVWVHVRRKSLFICLLYSFQKLNDVH